MSDKKIIIEIGIVNKYATAAGAPVIVCDNAGDTGYQVQFTFDEDWEGLEHKTARFVYVQDGAVRHQDVVFTGDTVDVPMLSNIREVHIGVFSGDLCTSSPAVVLCQPSIRCESGAPEAPTPDVYDQIIALLNNLNPGGGGTAGADGKSAYEIAVENGFEGTEAEWLTSLKGADGKDGKDGKDAEDVDLSGYATFKYVDSKIDNVNTRISGVNAQLEGIEVLLDNI